MSFIVENGIGKASIDRRRDVSLITFTNCTPKFLEKILENCEYKIVSDPQDDNIYQCTCSCTEHQQLLLYIMQKMFYR
jgi:hypothetical protein